MQASARFDLLTIGHSNQSAERFVALLRGTGVDTVADVRSVPFSRRFPWFSGQKLAARLQGTGIAYLRFGDALGGRPRALLRWRGGLREDGGDGRVSHRS